MCVYYLTLCNLNRSTNGMKPTGWDFVSNWILQAQGLMLPRLWGLLRVWPTGLKEMHLRYVLFSCPWKHHLRYRKLWFRSQLEFHRLGNSTMNVKSSRIDGRTIRRLHGNKFYSQTLRLAAVQFDHLRSNRTLDNLPVCESEHSSLLGLPLYIVQFSQGKVAYDRMEKFTISDKF